MACEQFELILTTDEGQREFEKFHAANPQVMGFLVARIRETLKHVRLWDARLSMRMFWEMARYERIMKATGGNYALNNNLAPYYAREIMNAHPQWRGVFQTRGGK
jgi:diadenosine tetraphosphate (Ap4A) HIT family hydrolase